MHETSAVVDLVGAVVALLLAAAAVLAVSRRLRLPFTVLLVVAGILLSLAAEAGLPPLEPLADLAISSDLVLYVFLPTLVFESAFNLDVRQLRHNLVAVLTLAVPGVLLATGVIGALVAATTGLPLATALLLGAVLSATDPVAVVTLFRRINAPRRLLTLVEGESLFNDATAIVLARLLAGVLAAGALTAGEVAAASLEFLVLFLGGLGVGVALGLAAGYLLGRVESEPRLEITLTTIAAYLAFLLAEEVLRLSGVMAAVGAGLVLGGWGRVRVSASVAAYLEQFWGYMAFVANALIFLLVGLTVDPGALVAAAGPLAWVIAAMLLSRALVVYGLVPLAGRLPRMEPIGWRYQTVMFWGGLRGAVGLAIALSLPAVEHQALLVTLVTGAVLFTLLVQGLTVEPLMRALGLDRPPLADRYARVETALEGVEMARERIPGLRRGGLFSGRVARELEDEVEGHRRRLRAQMEALRGHGLDETEERRLLYLRALSEEKSLYLEMFHQGHLGERTLRELWATLSRQEDAVRGYGELWRAGTNRRRRFDRHLADLLERLGLDALAERLRKARVVTDYEAAWGRYRAAAVVLERLEGIMPESARPGTVEEVRAFYGERHGVERERLDRLGAQFPEFVATMQRRLGRQLVLAAETEAVERESREGTLQAGVAARMRGEIEARRAALVGGEAKPLSVDAGELLRAVPFCGDLPEEVLAAVAARMREHTVPEGEPLVRQGDPGDALFLVVRGVVRVSVEEAEGGRRDLATLLAGDYFGERAVLHATPYEASLWAVAPALVYVLQRGALEAVMARYPEVRTGLEEAVRAEGRA